MNAKLIPHCEMKRTFNIVRANAFFNRFLCFPRPPLWPGHNFTMSGCIRASCTTSRPSKHVTASNSPGDISIVPKGEEHSQMELDETSMVLRDCEFYASLSWLLLLIREDFSLPWRPFGYNSAKMIVDEMCPLILWPFLWLEIKM